SSKNSRNSVERWKQANPAATSTASWIRPSVWREIGHSQKQPPKIWRNRNQRRLDGRKKRASRDRKPQTEEIYPCEHQWGAIRSGMTGRTVIGAARRERPEARQPCLTRCRPNCRVKTHKIIGQEMG